MSKHQVFIGLLAILATVAQVYTQGYPFLPGFYFGGANSYASAGSNAGGFGGANSYASAGSNAGGFGGANSYASAGSNAGGFGGSNSYASAGSNAGGFGGGYYGGFGPVFA
ncbi:circumsporozoite protein-like [Leptopilina boulardi]|uniref:circumsporozoite protein-like n=1 Tax=Leptopilina boulardi TaxID=63433 RepID=UPI0021F5C383|nr:circumsporozoite protein-like [Leptopilina boulardi]